MAAHPGIDQAAALVRDLGDIVIDNHARLLEAGFSPEYADSAAVSLSNLLLIHTFGGGRRV